MASYNIPDNQVTTYNISDANSTYTQSAGGTIDTSDFGGEGIVASEFTMNDTININGMIDAVDFDGIVLNGQYTTVNVGKDADIEGDTGINFFFDGDGGEDAGNSVTNLGKINGATTGIYSQDFGTEIDNSGSIHGGQIGINVFFYGATIINEKDGEITGKQEALHFSLISKSDTVTVTNDGTISGRTALDFDDNRDVVTNHGTIHGAINLNGGSDTFDGRGGTTDGVIFGGDGDDMFFISDAAVKLKEDANNGTDTVQTTVSFTLGNNFETLILLGKGNINGTGEKHGNDIEGNDGKNILSGGAGDDTLSGGGQVDHFIFAKGFDQDEITDFTFKGRKHDIVDLSGTSIKSWDDLKAHHLATSHGSAVIDAGHGDTLTIDGVAAAKLNEHDFSF